MVVRGDVGVWGCGGEAWVTLNSRAKCLCILPTWEIGEES